MHWQASWTRELINHLWQSTLFVTAIWLLTIALRHNRANTRYKLWMLASAKFLIPFSILITAGEFLQPRTNASFAPSYFSVALGDLAEPFASTGHIASPKPVISSSTRTISHKPVSEDHQTDWLTPSLLFIWCGGTLLLLGRWVTRWWLFRSIVCSASPTNIKIGVPVLSTQERLEPGIFGVIRPVLLLPEGITDRLTTSQMDAILAHELCHVERRDNLTAAFHMIVESLFWFHPAVWWIRARLIEERERACDEAVLASRREALTYAEGILNVCKLYVEAPSMCVSGVTGSDLKKRITRIMSEQIAHKLDMSRKFLLATAGVLAVAGPIVFGVMHVTEVRAQTAAQKTGIDDTWQGTLHALNRDLRIVAKITKADNGSLKVATYSIDQGGQPIPASKASFEGSELKFAVEMIDGNYDGKMSSDAKSITGTWTQGEHPLPLVLERTTAETAWAIPEPPPKLPPMAADADPSFEVATVKPSKPGAPGKGFRLQANRFTTINTTLTDLITFAYGIQGKQIISGPAWMDTDKYDIAGQPDVPGQPNDKQAKVMVQKLLADRFQLKFHRDKKELSAYLLTVAKGGPKLKKSETNNNGVPGLFFTKLGRLNVRNATMVDFAGVMQTGVFDRPVVDQTGLEGRWDFILSWTPDETQFSSFGVKVPPPSEAADAPPPIFTAIQEQIGLKLDAGKAPVEVLVLDHVDRPSEN